MSQPILSIENLAISFHTPFGKVIAVKDVSFSLHQGEILGIVGESGSGKSVSCRSILGLLAKTAVIDRGQILYEGLDLLKLKENELVKIRGEKITMIFQTPSTYLDPLMTAGAQVGEPLQLHAKLENKEIRQRSIELLDDVRIKDPQTRVDSFPHELSGGMKQRLMIATVLACQPKILIADEPTTGLDVTVQAGILKLLKQLREEHNLSIIMVSHDLGVIAETCDRVVVMRDGQVVETGSTRQILLQPQAAYTRKLISSHPGIYLSMAAEEEQIEDKPEEKRTPIIRVEDLSVTFGYTGWLQGKLPVTFMKPPIHAVQQVTFELQQGESLGLVGESGSGKSTIARAIVRLNQPCGGKILFKGKPVLQMGTKELLSYRRAVQMIFQDPFSSLNPRMTVEQTLSEPLRKHNLCPPDQIESRVKELLESVELSAGLLNRKPHELSGGQCQRVGVARALTLNPEILIADEMTSALDVTIQAQLLDLVEKLRRDMGLTIILISHDLGVVRRLCDRIVVLHNGRVVEFGSAREIIARPTQAYTQELIAAVPRMPVNL